MCVLESGGGGRSDGNLGLEPGFSVKSHLSLLGLHLQPLKSVTCRNAHGTSAGFSVAEKLRILQQGFLCPSNDHSGGWVVKGRVVGSQLLGLPGLCCWNLPVR